MTTTFPGVPFDVAPVPDVRTRLPPVRCVAAPGWALCAVIEILAGVTSEARIVCVIVGVACPTGQRIVPLPEPAAASWNACPSKVNVAFVPPPIAYQAPPSRAYRALAPLVPSVRRNSEPFVWVVPGMPVPRVIVGSMPGVMPMPKPGPAALSVTKAL